jgi:hypothetical protein
MSTVGDASPWASREAPRVGGYRRGNRVRTTPAGTWFAAASATDEPAGLLLVHPAVDLEVLVPTVETLADLRLPGVLPTERALAAQAGRNWLAATVPPVPTLADFLNAGANQEPRYAAALLTEVGDTLLAVHRAGLLHGMVNPASLVIGPTGAAMLTDWGTSTAATPRHDIEAWAELAQLLAQHWCADDPPAADVLTAAAELAYTSGLLTGIDELAALTGATRRAVSAAPPAGPAAGAPTEPITPPGAAAPTDSAPIHTAPTAATATATPGLLEAPTATEPTGAQPTSAEPTDAVQPPQEPAPAESTSTEPTRAEPTGRPTPADPAEAAPAPVQPTEAKPTSVEPAESAAPRAEPGSGAGPGSTLLAASAAIWASPGPHAAPIAQQPGTTGTWLTTPAPSPVEPAPDTDTDPAPDKLDPAGPVSSRLDAEPTEPLPRWPISRSSLDDIRTESPGPSAAGLNPFAAAPSTSRGTPEPGEETDYDDDDEPTRHPVLTVLGGLVALALAAGAALLVAPMLRSMLSNDPLTVDGVELRSVQQGSICRLIADVVTNGKAGTVVYQWKGDISPEPVMTISVPNNVHQIEMGRQWDAISSPVADPLIALQVLQPNPRRASAQPATECR